MLPTYRLRKRLLKRLNLRLFSYIVVVVKYTYDTLRCFPLHVEEKGKHVPFSKLSYLTYQYLTWFVVVTYRRPARAGSLRQTNWLRHKTGKELPRNTFLYVVHLQATKVSNLIVVDNQLANRYFVNVTKFIKMLLCISGALRNFSQANINKSLTRSGKTYSLCYRFANIKGLLFNIILDPGPYYANDIVLYIMLLKLLLFTRMYNMYRQRWTAAELVLYSHLFTPSAQSYQNGKTSAAADPRTAPSCDGNTVHTRRIPLYNLSRPLYVCILSMTEFPIYIVSAAAAAAACFYTSNNRAPSSSDSSAVIFISLDCRLQVLTSSLGSRYKNATSRRQASMCFGRYATASATSTIQAHTAYACMQSYVISREFKGRELSPSLSLERSPFSCRASSRSSSPRLSSDCRRRRGCWRGDTISARRGRPTNIQMKSATRIRGLQGNSSIDYWEEYSLAHLVTFAPRNEWRRRVVSRSRSDSTPRWCSTYPRQIRTIHAITNHIRGASGCVSVFVCEYLRERGKDHRNATIRTCTTTINT